MDTREADKALYHRWRGLSCEELWSGPVAHFNQLRGQDRVAQVAAVRALGVVFARSGSPAQKAEARSWLRSLLSDSSEKVRRYAMAALPKIGAGPGEEVEILDLLHRTASEREKEFVGRVLEKIGGTATLRALGSDEKPGRGQTEQKIKARLVRSQSPSTVRMDSLFDPGDGLRIHLRTRAGLEQLLREEVEASAGGKGNFRIAEVRRGVVSIRPAARFSLEDLYRFRCFGTAGFVLGTASGSEPDSIEALAAVITAPESRRLLEAFTEGPIRYRLVFAGKGHQRGAVRQLANQVYSICPELLNDPRSAPWSISIHSWQGGHAVELSPKLTPDPRFIYRQGDVPAASHPPLAACMARLAGPWQGEIVWDPFCGSGVELVERALLGGVERVYGTDLSAAAIETARTNYAAANLPATQAQFLCCDFRDFGVRAEMPAARATLVITNPPLGKRVPIPNLKGLITDLFAVAAKVLRPGGRLVFINPLRIEQPPHPAFALQSRQVVDVGILEGRLEKYVKRERTLTCLEAPPRRR